MSDKYMPCHSFQREMCRTYGIPILNVGCKEDPAHLGRDFCATNVDIEDFDIETRQSLYDVPYFVQGSALDLPFEDGMYAHVVLGEFLEHCTFDAAKKALTEASRVLNDDDSSRITLTFPLDSRPPEVQRPKHELRTYCDGITSWHQTVWGSHRLDSLLDQCNLACVLDRTIRYSLLDYKGMKCFGAGLVLKKD